MPPTSPRSRGRQRDRQEAPASLLVVQAFLNTIDLHTGADVWANPAALERWAVGKGLLPARTNLTDDDLARAREVRKGLRAALGDNAANSTPFEALEEAAGEAVLRVRFEPGGRLRLEPAATGIDGALGRVFAHIVTAQEEGLWHRFRVCARATCRAAFYDVSRNRSAKWCRPGCGEWSNAHRSRIGGRRR